ncbi:hypothetical protein MTDSW087_02324 [Methylobacterium dankookense]|uniref:DUF5722 domain-containing protein n=2 Tax=Methylobacterium dankookense TaxID=560405 RepID=A0A564FZ15_9HYPH|nr:hypothetical protein IFDJLNFL_3314 [Methylobacterium dankookense]VUF12631.1 hypothetical protein MTDSW087_02324 [Methylobacterium dankookense]
MEFRAPASHAGMTAALAGILLVLAVQAGAAEAPGPAEAAACMLNGRSIPHGGAVTVYPAPVAAVDAACIPEGRSCANGRLTGTATFDTCFARQRFISATYVPPSSKQGVHDFRLDDPAEIQDARYAAFRRMGLGYKEYNLFWRGLETEAVPSSADPVACPAGSFMVPASEAERAAWGFHRFRCFSEAQVALFDRQIARDAASGMQSGAVLWAAPERYRDPACLGSPFGGVTLKDGCVPRDDAMDDFEDYVAFVANRYSGRGGHGKISHLIVWNEAASAVFFDYSPVVATRGRPGPEDEARWLAKYADLVARAHDAVQRNSAGIMLYASTDLHWSPPRIGPADPAHIGSRTLVDGLWRHLGTRVSWSVAVHPYGNLDRAPAPGTYSFLNLDLVVEHQKAKLQALGLPTTSLEHPQAYLIASEQGWPQSIGIERQARFLCQAHALALQAPTLLAQAHNYFQSVEAQEGVGGRSNQGAFYGLIPYAAPIDLSTVDRYPTGAAYLATAPAEWGRSGANACCRQAGVGCRIPAGTAPVYRWRLGDAHLYARDLAEGPKAGMAFEGTAFTLFTAGGEDRAPLYRCRGGRFLSRDASCEGQAADGDRIGYVHPSARPGLVPLHRPFDAASGEHRITLGYVPEP